MSSEIFWLFTGPLHSITAN